MERKVYIRKTTKIGNENKIEYKQYKCIDGWTRYQEKCWKFSIGGAKKIVERLNKRPEYNAVYDWVEA